MLERLLVNLTSGLFLMYLGLYAIPEWKAKRAEAKEEERLHQETIEEYDEKIKKIRAETEKLRADNKARREALERRLSGSAKYIDTQQLTQLLQNIKSELAAESSASYIDEITTVDIKRSGKLVFTLHVHPISDKDLHAAKVLAMKDGEMDAALFNSWIIFMATTQEDQKQIWGNAEVMLKFSPDKYKPLAPVETIDRLLTAGEKFTLVDVIVKISGFNQDDEEPEKEDEPDLPAATTYDEVKEIADWIDTHDTDGEKDKLRHCPICDAEVNAGLECWPGHRKLTIVCEKCGLRFENSQEFREYMTAGGKYHYIPVTPDPVEIWQHGLKGD